MEITCGECGQSNDVGLWLLSSKGEELPCGQLQCPEYQVAICQKVAPPTFFTVNDKTMTIPGNITLEPVETI